MIIQFLFVGGAKVDWLQAFTEEYVDKIARHYKTEVIRLSPSAEQRALRDVKRAAESEKILSKLKPTDFVVALDERGEVLTSAGFAKKFEGWLNRGRQRMVFIVGGAFGLDQSCRERADATIALSAMILNHHVAQAVLLEQVYRAISINKNLPYHNEG